MVRILKSIILTTVILLTATGCLFFNFEGAAQKYDADQAFKNQCEDLLTYLENSDSDSIKDMFSEAAKNYPELYTEIKELVNYFNSKITSHDSYRLEDTQEKWREGQLTFYDGMGVIKNIEVESSGIYSLYFGTMLIDVEKPERVGIAWISIYNESDCIIDVGDYTYVY